MRIIYRIKQHSLIWQNLYFILGMLLGFSLLMFIPEGPWSEVIENCQDSPFSSNLKDGHDFEPKLNLVNKPMAAKKIIKNILRPRYYSSELGIREKVFVGVLTSQKRINTLATAFNKTTAHLVNKIKFFINADNVKSNFKLKNIVGFTDTRENLRPFHVLKYIADNYINDYDFFILTTDEVYFNARRLIDQMNHLSIMYDVYMGTPVRSEEDYEAESSYCDINYGIILSSSVIKKIRANLDWCVQNAASNLHSLNVGKCVKYSSKLSGCQQSFQGITFKSFQLNSYEIDRDIQQLTNSPKFNNATFLYPVTSAHSIYKLHTYFSRFHLEEIRKKGIHIERNAHNISNRTISNDILEIKWPLGVPGSGEPETRYDILAWDFLNVTHQFMPNHELNIKSLTVSDVADLNRVLNRSIIQAEKSNSHLKYLRVHSIYRRFDSMRGIDYRLHLYFSDKRKNVEIIKSFEVMKPLGQIEIIPSPYVTESTRIALLLPIFVHQVSETIDFIKRYEKMCMENQDNTFLMLVFLYEMNSANKGIEDVFYSLKSIALSLSEKYKSDNSRIAWVSIRLPEPEFFGGGLGAMPNNMLPSMYGEHEILSLVVTDLALRKIGLDSLVMICSNKMSFKADYLNRVRMNTVQGFQIFSPIGFRTYPCEFTNFCKECETCDVSQGSGYFDVNSQDVIAFYSTDYVQARKYYESMVPIIHSDTDIDQILKRPDKTVNNILDIFVKSQLKIHILRATEPNLRFDGSIDSATQNITFCQFSPVTSNSSSRCNRLASRKQISYAILKFEDTFKN